MLEDRIKKGIGLFEVGDFVVGIDVNWIIEKSSPKREMIRAHELRNRCAFSIPGRSYTTEIIKLRGRYGDNIDVSRSLLLLFSAAKLHLTDVKLGVQKCYNGKFLQLAPNESKSFVIITKVKEIDSDLLGFSAILEVTGTSLPTCGMRCKVGGDKS